MQVNEQEVFDILTGKISTTINRALLRAFAHADVAMTTEQWSVMSCLWHEEKVTQQQLCDLTRKDKPSMTRLIDNLEKNHLVFRYPHSTDRRVNLIHLTKEGIDLREKVINIVKGVVDKAMMDISEDEVAISRRLLTKIISNLDS